MRILYLLLFAITSLSANLTLELNKDEGLYKLEIKYDKPFDKAYIHFIDNNDTEVFVKEIINLDNLQNINYYLPRNLYTDMDVFNSVTKSIVKIAVSVGNDISKINIPQFIFELLLKLILIYCDWQYP